MPDTNDPASGDTEVQEELSALGISSLVEYVSGNDLTPLEQELLIWETLDAMKRNLGRQDVRIYAMETLMEEMSNLNVGQTERLEMLLSNLSILEQQNKSPVQGRRNTMNDKTVTGEEVQNEGMSTTTKMIAAGIGGLVVGGTAGVMYANHRNNAKMEQLQSELQSLKLQFQPAGR